ncbi:MAG: hypothetical protein ABIR55_20015 [Burkholderiaceae bacterium]
MNAPKWKPGSLKIAASLAALVAVGVGLIVSMLHIPQAVAATRAALVELIAPSRPFFGSANGSANYATIGPGSTGVLAVSSITLTNFGSTLRTVFIFRPVLADGATCGSSEVAGGSSPRFYVIVPPAQTVHLTYPVPIVYSAASGLSCVAFGGALNVDISLNGFLQ